MALSITGVRCNNCGDVIYSRHRHDYRECSCASVAVDGGIACERIIGGNYTVVMFQLERKFQLEDLEKDFLQLREGGFFGKIAKEDQTRYTFFVEEK